MKIDDLEQTLPDKPRFGLILGLVAVAILVFFVLALAFLRIEDGHLSFRHHTAHPTSQLIRSHATEA